MPPIKLSRGINALCFACAFIVPLALSFLSVIAVPPAASGTWAYGQTGTTEFFSTSNSAHYGAHGGEWDPNHLKGECPAGAIAVGIAQTRSIDHQVDTLRCARTTPQMCMYYRTAFELNRRCRTVRLSYGPALYQSRDWDFNHDKASCAVGEAVVGVSVDTANHHPHAILCCQLDQFSC